LRASAIDREGRDAEVRERMRVVSHFKRRQTMRPVYAQSAPGSGFAARRLLQRWPGIASSNASRPPIELSLGTDAGDAKKPGHNRGVAVVFQV
jgi:hypothetical protein